MRSHHRSRSPRRGARNPGDGGGSGLLLLVGAGAFLFLTQTGQSLLSSFGLGVGAPALPPGTVTLPNGQYQLPTGQIVSPSQLVGIPPGLPPGTIRLPNGQYQTPAGQVVGPPTMGQPPVMGSSSSFPQMASVALTTLAAVPPLIAFFQRLFPAVQGGTAPPTAGATGSPGAGGSVVSVPAPTDPSVAVNVPIGQLTLNDGSVLYFGGVAAPNLGVDLSLTAPTLELGTSFEVPPTPLTLDLTAPALGFDPTLQLPDIGAAAPVDLSWAPMDLTIPDVTVFPEFPAFGALSPSRRVGFVPVPMRHG